MEWNNIYLRVRVVFYFSFLWKQLILGFDGFLCQTKLEMIGFFFPSFTISRYYDGINVHGMCENVTYLTLMRTNVRRHRLLENYIDIYSLLSSLIENLTGTPKGIFSPRSNLRSLAGWTDINWRPSLAASPPPSLRLCVWHEIQFTCTVARAMAF